MPGVFERTHTDRDFFIYNRWTDRDSSLVMTDRQTDIQTDRDSPTNKHQVYMEMLYDAALCGDSSAIILIGSLDYIFITASTLEKRR